MNEEKFLLVKGIGGLGNRMECALTGILCARLSGRRLLIDWSDHCYSNDGSNVFHRFFQCSACPPTDEIPTTDSVSPGIWRGHLHRSAWDMRAQYGGVFDSETWRKFSIDLTKLNYREDVVVMWTHSEKVDLLRDHFKGAFKEFAAASSGAILSNLLEEDLILHPDIRERVDQFRGTCFTKKTVGVHVRYTDFRSRLWTILKKLNALLKREPDLLIFLSTDNMQIKNMFEASYPGVIITPHWYSSTPGLAIHGNRNCQDPIESGIEALVDLYLLAECDYLIIDTNSSFSYVAKLLTKTPDSNIFDVGQRKKPSPYMRALTTRLMLKLGLYSWGLSLLSRFVRIQRSFNV